MFVIYLCSQNLQNVRVVGDEQVYVTYSYTCTEYHVTYGIIKKSLDYKIFILCCHTCSVNVLFDNFVRQALASKLSAIYNVNYALRSKACHIKSVR